MERWIGKGKLALRWTRLSCRAFGDDAVRLRLFALAYDLADFLRSLALPDEVAQRSLTTLPGKFAKIGARIVRHGRYVAFRPAEVAWPVPRALFATTLRRIDRLRGTARRGGLTGTDRERAAGAEGGAVRRGRPASARADRSSLPTETW